MIRRAGRDGREVRGNEEREERGLRKGAERAYREKRKRQKDKFEEEGLRAPVSSSPRGMTSWSSNIKIWFLQAYRMHY